MCVSLYQSLSSLSLLRFPLIPNHSLIQKNKVCSLLQDCGKGIGLASKGFLSLSLSVCVCVSQCLSVTQSLSFSLSVSVSVCQCLSVSVSVSLCLLSLQSFSLFLIPPFLTLSLSVSLSVYVSVSVSLISPVLRELSTGRKTLICQRVPKRNPIPNGQKCQRSISLCRTTKLSASLCLSPPVFLGLSIVRQNDTHTHTLSLSISSVDCQRFPQKQEGWRSGPHHQSGTDRCE